ncbi:hypothetical protein F53441_5140 [Fusarium austroafricanum]|uniref:Helicase ATP-binding domain-containing protein n=1 Tax=Fusarium austroafricanum TaxID=2364996 RepID=A0A8H4KIK1_9HYPO|nr:hypothetical protein F53441_5140 [Fusarium austroafricanum]
MGGTQKAPREQSPIEIITQHVTHKDNLSAPGNLPWQMMPEMPNPSELAMIDPAPLPQPPSDKESNEKDAKNSYLEFQYLMNRYEGTELLRQAVNAFRNDPAMMEGDDFYIYTQVHVQGYLFAKSGPACRISFSTERSSTRVAWSQSGRLTAGTLVVLSPRSDNFNKECFVAVVAARYLLGGLLPNPEDNEDENTPPRIEIIWSNCDTAVFDPEVEMVMLEAKGGYFETVRHTMVGLQHAAKAESKFETYIIDGSNKERTAAYLTDVPGQTPRVPERAALFDHSQKKAFDRMTHKELAVIQGPPGTGKTFTSVVALESYVQTLRAGQDSHEAVPPVIVAAQTNHALDQLLGRCSVEFDPIFARLGGRTEDEAIERCSLYNLRKDSKLSRGPTRGERVRKTALGRIEKLLLDCFPAYLISPEEFRQEGLISEEQYNSLDDPEWESADVVDTNTGEIIDNPFVHWLGNSIEPDTTYVYRPPTHQTEPPVNEEENINESREENDKERLQGDFFPMKFHFTGAISESISSARARNELKRHQNLWNINEKWRGALYRTLRRDLIIARAKRFPQLLKEYQAACVDVQISRVDRNVKIIKDEKIEILGCTTTGLSKYRGLIAALKPRILMIEEAAETREANISAALYPSLDQIVLVGDHQQLVPQVDVRELQQEPYNMNISMFERLVKLELPYSMLRVQRRMAPNIRDVVNAFYPKLTDHASVTDLKHRPPVPGMGRENLWWFYHEGQEMRDTDSPSFSNPDEANMIVGFVRYLVYNGVLPREITVLTFYNGQVALVREKLRQDPVLTNKNPTGEWSVRTVDGFQGEENKIVLLSTVRSSGPGFVSNENRAVVATSRAKCGMYIFGNAFALMRTPKGYQTWSTVYDKFNDRGHFNKFLPVTCENHGIKTLISCAEDWDTVSGGGCKKPCEHTCPEGHPCGLTCHPYDQPEVKCQSRCEKVLDCGHQCSSLCGTPCKCLQQQCQAPALSLPLQAPRLPRPSSKATLRAVGTGGKGQKKATKGKKGGASRWAPSPNSASTSEQSTLRASAYHNQVFPDAIAVGHNSVTSSHSSLQGPTSEELMEGDYFKNISKKWSPEKVLQKEQEANQMIKQFQSERSPGPVTKITTMFRQTKMTANCAREYGEISKSTYTTTNLATPEQVEEVSSEEDLMSFD